MPSLAQAGGDGGCEAAEVWRQEEGEQSVTYDRKVVLRVPDVPVGAVEELVDPEDLGGKCCFWRSRFAEQKKEKGNVP